MYSPKLSEDLVRRLYPVCREVGVPMTMFVNGAMERAVLRAEEYVAMGEKQRVRDMISCSVPGPSVEEKRRAEAAG